MHLILTFAHFWYTRSDLSGRFHLSRLPLLEAVGLVGGTVPVTTPLSTPRPQVGVVLWGRDPSGPVPVTPEGGKDRKKNFFNGWPDGVVGWVGWRS